MKVYVVTVDGYNQRWGSEIYLVGVFTKKERALQAAINDKFDITEIVLDEEHTLRTDNWGDSSTDLFLGGYVE